MSRIFGPGIGLLLAGLLASAGAEESLRPEVGKALQAAQDLVKHQKFKEALGKIQEAEAVGNKTPYESFIIERMRGTAASGAGDAETAARAFEAVIASGRLPAAEQLKMMEALIANCYRAKAYAKALAWGQRYAKEGGTNPQVRSLQIQAQYLSGDYSGAIKELNADFAAGDKAGAKPAEDRLQLLANCYLNLKDHAGYAATLEKLVTHYSKKEYWADLINRIQRKPGFAERLALDAFRLQYATGNLQDAGDYVEMAQLALQAGLPAEAKKMVDEGYARNLLGTGAEAERHKRLRDLANRQAAEDEKALPQNEKQAEAAPQGTALANLGYAYVTLGRADKGIVLLDKGLAKGNLKYPEDAKLHLGVAQLQAGDHAKGIQTLRSVQGNDGTADLARLWLAYAARGR